MESKLSQLRALMEAEDWPKALAMAAKFPRLGAEKAVITRAHECLTHPAFYAQLPHLNIPDAIQAGIAALKAKYSR